MVENSYTSTEHLTSCLSRLYSLRHSHYHLQAVLLGLVSASLGDALQRQLPLPEELASRLSELNRLLHLVMEVTELINDVVAGVEGLLQQKT